MYDTAQRIARNLGDRTLEYSIANGRQNVERRFGAFLLEVERNDSADKHFSNALGIIRSMEAIRPKTEDATNEKVARYRVFWEWRKYDEALSEVKSLLKDSDKDVYKEDMAAILIETRDIKNVELAYKLLGMLVKTGFVVASLAEASSIVESDFVVKNKILDDLNQVIVSDDPVNRDPYLYYVKALLHKSSSQDNKALDAISEAIRIERARSSNLYTFDPVRFEKYMNLKSVLETTRK